MSALSTVFNTAITYIKAYVNLLNQNWLTQTFLFLVVLDIIITSILFVRGSK